MISKNNIQFKIFRKQTAVIYHLQRVQTLFVKSLETFVCTHVSGYVVFLNNTLLYVLLCSPFTLNVFETFFIRSTVYTLFKMFQNVLIIYSKMNTKNMPAKNRVFVYICALSRIFVLSTYFGFLRYLPNAGLYSDALINVLLF